MSFSLAELPPLTMSDDGKYRQECHELEGLLRGNPAVPERAFRLFKSFWFGSTESRPGHFPCGGAYRAERRKYGGDASGAGNCGAHGGGNEKGTGRGLARAMWPRARKA